MLKDGDSGLEFVTSTENQTPETIAAESCEETAWIDNPISGSVVDPADADGLISAIEQCKETYDVLGRFYGQLRRALGDLTTGDAKTRRVRGNQRRAVVTMPGDRWEQSILKEAWNAYPQLRDQVLKIDKIGVKLRELKKIENESGPDSFEQFKKMILSARSKSDTLPTIKIEE